MTGISATWLQGIAALIAAIGAILIFERKFKKDRDEERRRRSEAVRDLVRAVHADIRVEHRRLVAAFGPGNGSEIEAALLANIRQAVPKPMPRTGSKPPSLVLDSLRKEITLLPEQIVEPVIAFYNLDQGLSAVEAAFSNGVYDDLGPARQEAALMAYLAAGRDALSAGEAALDALRSLRPEHDPHRPMSGMAGVTQVE